MEYPIKINTYPDRVKIQTYISDWTYLGILNFSNN